MAHLDLKRAALSESAKQLTETIKATSNNQGDIRFIQTLPGYTDLRLIEAAETAAGCRQTGTTQSCRHHLLPQKEDARERLPTAASQRTLAALRTNVHLC